MNPDFKLSVAIPVYNEEATLPLLLKRLSSVLDTIPGGPHEIVIVDDGSTDRTSDVLRAAVRDPRITAILLSRNFGHQAALTAALDHVSGDATVVMDADLQDVPEAIPTLVDQFFMGFDVVYAERVKRKESAFLRLCYYGYYRIASRLANSQLPVDAGDFGLMSRRVVHLVRQMPERHRYLRGLRAWTGFKQIGVPIERGVRAAGESKYGPLALLKLAFDGIFAFSVLPLRAAAFVGFFAVVISALFGAYALFARLFLSQSPRGFTALILTIIFLSGIQLFFLGVIGEYLGRLYEEAKARPVYVVDKVMRGAIIAPGGDKPLSELDPDTPDSLIPPSPR